MARSELYSSSTVTGSAFIKPVREMAQPAFNNPELKQLLKEALAETLLEILAPERLVLGVSGSS